MRQATLFLVLLSGCWAGDAPDASVRLGDAAAAASDAGGDRAKPPKAALTNALAKINVPKADPSSRFPAVDPDAPRATDEEFKKATDAHVEWTLRFLRAVGKDKNKNVFFSPFSIQSALSMTATGARGKTLAQMNKSLALTGQKKVDPALIARVSARTLDGLKPGEDDRMHKLAVANRFYAERSIPFHEEYKMLLHNGFGAPMDLVDFRGQPEVQRDAINAWVQDQTHNLIVDLLPSGTIRSDTSTVLVNAVWFKGQWATFFDGGAPMRTFYGARKKTKTPTMSTVGSYRYYADKTLLVVRLLYDGYETEMVIVAPQNKRVLPAVEKRLTRKKLSRLIDKAGHRRLELFLPKFKISQSHDLKKTLKHKFGLRDAFSPRSADFGGMSPSDLRFALDEVLHKAVIVVDEKGTEAAAATAVVMMGLESIPPPPLPVKIDRPFVFFIRHIKTGIILFAGRYAQP